MPADMVIICDSRGRHLQEYIQSASIKVLFYSGANLDALLRMSHSRCLGLNPRYILIHGGICNMSTKDRRTGQIRLVFEDHDELLGHMCAVFTAAWIKAREMYPQCQVIMSGLCGMDINKYNGLPGYHSHQSVVNRVIEQLNHHIVDLNFRAGAYQPKLTTKVHKKSNKYGHRNQYRLLTDGIHPGVLVLKDWGKNISSLYSLLVAKDASH